MKLALSDWGLAICANSQDSLSIREVQRFAPFKLSICDPPYGEIVDGEAWEDRADYFEWLEHCVSLSADDSTICMWGGTGKRKNRPFIEFASLVEKRFPTWEIKNWITWGKKRAYGVQDNYLYTREECLILTRGNPTFNIPLLDRKRGYEGYNKEYPAKSEYLRRTNVWTDISELFRGKIHRCQKPDELYQVLIKTHSNQGDYVYDPCAGSCVTMRASVQTLRKYVIVEQQLEYMQRAGLFT